MKPTLLILAAGMGSRYGSLKQVDQLGPSGETIIEYSVFDAMRAGFGKVVFVIRESIQKEFKAVFADKFAGKIEVDYVLQELDNVPEGIEVPADRVKPWGTGHAVMVAADAIQEPFAMINADDFYGKEAFEVMARYLEQVDPAKNQYSMVSYKLENTLSDHGFVSRGVCVKDGEDFLTSVTERTKIGRREDGQIVFRDEVDGEGILEADTLVSMNFWGFTPTIFGYAKEYFIEFIQQNFHQLKAEIYIPTVTSRTIEEEGATVKVLTSDAQWFGMTYKEDKAIVMGRLKELTNEGSYPSPLW
ncbi:MAG: sugar phosphate nucleotidyltransferase [Bacteroidota bacterium]